MFNFILILVLLILFYFLDKFADVVVTHTKKLADNLNIKVFFLGIVLGIVTTLPELSLGVNALIKGIPEVSLGNLLGGIIVIFTLILGGSIIINRKINTQDMIKGLGPMLLFLIIPMILGLKGNLGLFDGLIIIMAYITLVFYLFKTNSRTHNVSIKVVNQKESLKSLAYIIIGVALVMVISSLVIEVVERLLSHFVLPGFLVGLIFFSIGTNLPEITLVLKSWRRRASDLSISHLFGSAIANVLLIGVFISMQQVLIEVNLSYIILVITYAVLFVLLILFARSGKEFKRVEGIALLGVYILFLFAQMFLFLK